MPLITLEHAKVGYHEQPVLLDVTLRLYPGQLTVLRGANGSGKTTILKTLAGLLTPIDGRVRHYRNIDRPHPRCGYVPQRETLDPAYPLSAIGHRPDGDLLRDGLSGVPQIAPIKKRRCITSLRLDYKNSPISSSKHCQWDKDNEPSLHARWRRNPITWSWTNRTSGIDRESSQALFNLFKEFTRTSNLSILLVSHKGEEMVHNIADTVLRIGQGRLITESAKSIRSHMSTLLEMFSSDFLLKEALYGSLLLGMACPLAARLSRVETHGSVWYRSPPDFLSGHCVCLYVPRIWRSSLSS